MQKKGLELDPYSKNFNCCHDFLKKQSRKITAKHFKNDGIYTHSKHFPCNLSSEIHFHS